MGEALWGNWNPVCWCPSCCRLSRISVCILLVPQRSTLGTLMGELGEGAREEDTLLSGLLPNCPKRVSHLET